MIKNPSSWCFDLFSVERSIYLVIILFFLGSCGSKSDAPEQIVERYALLVNSGQLEQAKSMCTPAAAAYLDALSALVAGMDEGIDSSMVKIESIQCTLDAKQQTAHCEGVIDDGFERTQEVYFLRQQDGQWWIDRQPETGTLQTSEETLTPESSNQEE
ncbi:MAG: hypothetical protein AAFN81_08490 [Bacteroidota bacterium]